MTTPHRPPATPVHVAFNALRLRAEDSRAVLRRLRAAGAVAYRTRLFERADRLAVAAANRKFVALCRLIEAERRLAAEKQCGGEDDRA